MHNYILLAVVIVEREVIRVFQVDLHIYLQTQGVCTKMYMTFVHEGYRKRSRHSIIFFDCGYRVR
jgi:hypothetical protein